MVVMVSPAVKAKSGPDLFFLFLLLCFSPLALGSVNTWAFCSISFLASLFFCAVFLRYRAMPPHIARSPVLWAGAAFLIFNLIYLFPLPAGVLRAISPNAFSLRTAYSANAFGAAPLSMYPYATELYLIKFAAYFMAFLGVLARMRDAGTGGAEPHALPLKYSIILLGAVSAVLSLLIHSLCDFNLHIPANALYFSVMLAIISGLTAIRPENIDYRFTRKLMNFIIGISFVIAVFAIVQKLSWNGKIYWLIHKPGGNFGPYVNYDHFAGFMEMCAFLSISCFFAELLASREFRAGKRFREKIIWFSTKDASRTLVYFLCSSFSAASIFFSTSRGGIISFCLAGVVFLSVLFISLAGSHKSRAFAVFASLFVCVFLLFLWIGPEKTIARFGGMSKAVRAVISEAPILDQIRPAMWKDTAGLIGDFRATGTGLGTYEFVFSKYRTFVHDGFLRYAHNDYLQFVSELGLAAYGFLFLFFLWFFYAFRKAMGLIRKGSKREAEG
jgi:O-antigen ligase